MRMVDIELTVSVETEGCKGRMLIPIDLSNESLILGTISLVLYIYA
jgi:hypothetical protein